MIDKQGSRFYLVCDICNDDVICYSFQEAVDHKKTNGWQSKKYGDDWVDVCPDCWKDGGMRHERP